MIRSLILEDCKICTNCSACSSSPKSIEEALAFRCSENETVLVAAGKTIADDKYKGVIKKETTDDKTIAIEHAMITVLRFFQIKRMRFCLSLSNSLCVCSII